MMNNPSNPGDAMSEGEVRVVRRRVFGLREELLRYLSLAGRMFAITLENSHFDQQDIDSGTVPLPCQDEAPHALYHLVLCTQSLMDGNLYPAKECIDLSIEGDKSSRERIFECLHHLETAYPDRRRHHWQECGRWLYNVHAGYLSEIGHNMQLIERVLQIEPRQPEAEQAEQAEEEVPTSDEEDD